MRRNHKILTTTGDFHHLNHNQPPPQLLWWMAHSSGGGPVVLEFVIHYKEKHHFFFVWLIINYFLVRIGIILDFNNVTSFLFYFIYSENKQLMKKKMLNYISDEKLIEIYFH